MMNPAKAPVDTVPMLGPSEGFLGGPPRAPHPCTVVNIPAEPPKDHIIWSIICFSYHNICCLGLAALIYSFKVSFWGFFCESPLQIIRSHLCWALKRRFSLRISPFSLPGQRQKDDGGYGRGSALCLDRPLPQHLVCCADFSVFARWLNHSHCYSCADASDSADIHKTE